MICRVEIHIKSYVGYSPSITEVDRKFRSIFMEATLPLSKESMSFYQLQNIDNNKNRLVRTGAGGRGISWYSVWNVFT